jgi:hypothetical protein
VWSSVRQLEKHAGMAWPVQPAPAGKVLAAQLLDADWPEALAATEHEYCLLLSAEFEGPSRALGRPLQPRLSKRRACDSRRQRLPKSRALRKSGPR